MLTLFFSFLMAARADIPQRPQPGGFELKGEFDYMSTRANYPPNGGATQSLETRGKFVNMIEAERCGVPGSWITDARALICHGLEKPVVVDGFE